MRHLTIVYTIIDEESFAEELSRIQSLMTPSNGKPWAITAMSDDHEIQRVSDIWDVTDNAQLQPPDVQIELITDILN